MRRDADPAPRVVWLLLVLIFGLATIPVLVSPILPTIDFYDHVTRYYVLSHVGGDRFLAANYQANWSLLPNIGLDVIGTSLLSGGEVIGRSKLIALLIFAVQYAGILFFNRMLTGRVSVIVALLAVPLLYSFIFTWGFANFLLGLGLVFWGAGCWLAFRARLAIAIPVGVVMALAIFLTHGVAFALYGLLAGGLELGFFLFGERRVAALAKRLAALAVQALAPVALFLVSATAKSSDGVTNAAGSIQQLSEEGRLGARLVELIIYRLQTIARVAEGPALWFDLLTFLMTAGALLWLGRTGRLVIPRPAWPALFIGAVLMVAAPPAMFGVGYVADRMPLFLAFLAVGSLSFPAAQDRATRTCAALLLALVVVRIAWIVQDWRGYEDDLRAYGQVVAELPPQQVVAFVNVRLEHRVGPMRRCEMYGPLLVSRHGQASPLFAIPTAQPLKLKGRLAMGLNDLPVHRRFTPAEAQDYYRRTLQALAAQRFFDYALVCDGGRLDRPPTDGVVAQAGRFTLLKLR